VFVAKIRKLDRRTVSEPYERVIEDAQLVITKVFKGGLFVGQPKFLQRILGESPLRK
jgi:hypothetical protein